MNKRMGAFMDFEIIHLPKEQYKDHLIPITYTTGEYYDVAVQPEAAGFTVTIRKESFLNPVTHTPEEYDYPDKLYADYLQKPCAWGILDQGRLIAAIETDPEEWSGRLRITELWVDSDYQRQGIGHALMEVAREQARFERRRALILETQSCNVNAIGFYLHEGFTLIGMDTCCYTNNDPQRKEVRLELGWFPGRRRKPAAGEIEIRMERPEDWHEVERMTQGAFWNKYHKGCDEHYFVHRLRADDAYLPGISRIAVADGEVIGAILYSKALIQDKDRKHEILTFGPLCVSPGWQGCGVGELLLSETMKLAAAEGYPGIVIFGEPEYYPRMGFKACDHFGITTKEGKNLDAFMGIELIPGGMKDIHGSFHEAEVFEDLPASEVEKFNAKFPPMIRQYYPTQWD